MIFPLEIPYQRTWLSSPWRWPVVRARASALQARQMDLRRAGLCKRRATRLGGTLFRSLDSESLKRTENDHGRCSIFEHLLRNRTSRRLAADQDHRVRFVHVLRGRFARQIGAQCPIRRVGAVLAKQCLQLQEPLVHQAAMDPAARIQPEPVAAVAERLRAGCDPADLQARATPQKRSEE